MFRTRVFAFFVGVVFTAALYEVTGARLVRERTPLSAGAREVQIHPAPAPSGVAVRPTLRSPPSAQDHSKEAERLSEEVMVQRSRADFVEGQLEAVEGHAIPWPQDVLPAFKEDAVRKQLQEFVVSRGLAVIRDMDCSEYPCVGTLQLSEAGPQSMEKLHEALSEMIERYYDGPVALAITNSQSGHGTGAVGVSSVSVMPNDEEVKTRVRHRSEAAVQ